MRLRLSFLGSLLSSPLALGMYVALAVGVVATDASAGEPELGPAPMRAVDQDTTGWDVRGLTKAGRSRDEVVGLYRTTYLPGNAAPLSWTGSTASCNPGTTNLDHQQAVIARVNYYRALVNLPAVTLLTAAQPAQEQAAAIMFSANNALSHNPPASWLCYSSLGASGAGTSNIALGSNGVRSVDMYMDDFGTGNEATGHRRWILYPPQSGMATGDVSGGNLPPRPANALQILGAFGTRPATAAGIAWPPAGFVPYQNLPALSNRWSFSYPGASFGNAAVTIAGPTGTVPVSYENVANGYGDNTIVFKPSAFPYGKPAGDTSYAVTLSGLAGAGVPATIQYVVTVIDPDVATSSAPTVDVVEYYNSALDHYFITWAPNEIANLDAGRTPTRWERTGYAFKAYAAAASGGSPVCRLYIPPGEGDSHFFGRGTAECTATARSHPDFVLEETNFMFIILPSAGSCPGGTSPIYRVFSNRRDANHRYMTLPGVRNEMVARGWLAEGDGPDLVVMCAPS